jgi:hypothetical protein
MPTADLLQPAQLNSFNVHQLQYLGKNDQLDFYDQAVIPVDTSLEQLDYDARRMSSSATSTADTDSSMLSRGEKRSLTPGDSPLPKRQQRDSAEQWDALENSTAQSQSPHQQQMQHPDDRASDAGIDKVSLPSIFTSFSEDQYRHDSRRASLPTLSENRVRHAPYPPSHVRQQQNYAPSNLSTYSFPNNGDDGADRNISSRPRVSTDLNFEYSQSAGYPASGLSTGTTPSTSFSSSQFNSPLNPDIRTPGLSPYSENDNWNGASPAHIVRPSSTPGGLSSPAVKYDDGLRHSSFSAAPMPQAQMFAGSARISGQHDRRSLSGGIKSEWGFPNAPEFVLPSQHHHGYSPNLGTPNISVSTPSSARSPHHHHMPPQSTLVDRPPTRKRGKLPKETTDYLKAWLHRHSDHPYPSEEEKKQLCHATSLSMSQVSNWMINARRRILAPAHRAASGPTTTAPFPPSGRSSLNGLMDPIGRRASMPSADALQLYHPMSLQSMPNSPAGHHHHPHSTHHDQHSKYNDYIGGPARHMMGPGASSRHSDARSDYGHSNGHGSNGSSGGQGGRHGMGLYVSSTSGGHGSSGGYSDVPLSAPATMSGNPFSSSQQQGSNGAGAGGGGNGHLVPSPRPSGQTQYFDGPAHSGSGSGSGYGTPQ